MNIEKFRIQGPLLIDLKTFPDERGFFTERFRENTFSDLGIPKFVQDNFSRSSPRVIRGLHYQFNQPQSKLVTALSGRILDVIVDIRHESPNYGQYLTIELDGSKPQWLWIPAGFAHGFCVLGDHVADVMYKVDRYWNGAGESGISWNDPDLKIPWPFVNPIVSEKDSRLPSFQEYKLNPKH